MFTLARKITQHKIGVVAVVAFAVVMFSDDKVGEQPAQSSSPWGKSAPVQVAETKASDDDSFTAKLGEVAAEQLLGDKELTPVKLGGGAVDNFDNASAAFAKDNGNN
jgi:hypothetical protein